MAADGGSQPQAGRARSDGSGPGPAAGRLRPAISSFVGREADLEGVAEAIGGARLVSLTGPGGVGKSRLAREVVERAHPAPTERAAVVDLSELEDPTRVASTLTEGLGLAVDAADADDVSVTELLAAELGAGSRLLVLDNCEHVIGALSELVGRLLVGSAGLRVLVTSRQPLRIPGEVVWRVDPLPVPGADGGDSLAELLSVPSVRLFVDRARSANHRFAADDADAPAVAAICRRLDGLPLAIELAAAWASTLSPGEIDERLGRDLGLLRSPPGGPARHETLRAVFTHSYAQLTEGERVVFDRLGPFSGFSAEAAQAVCGPLPEGSGDIIEVLARLVDKSLLVVGQHAGRARYRRLVAARVFGGEVLDGLVDAGAVRRRHAEWFTALAEDTLAAAGPKALRDAEIEHDNFSAALGWAAREDRALALRLFSALRPFWETGGRVGEGRRWAQTLLGADAVPAVDAGLLSAARETAGALALAVGDHGPARAWLEAALSGFRALGDDTGTGRTLVSLGVLARYRGEIGHAELLLQEAAGLLSGRPAEATCLAELGQVTALSGREAEGERILLRALNLAREREDTAAAAEALNDLGKLAAVRGSLEVAERHHGQALELHDEMRRLRAKARTLGYLGEIALRRREFAKARSLYESALVVQRRVGDQRGLATSLTYLATIEGQQGRPVAAAQLHRQLVDLRRRMGDRRGEGRALAGLASAIWLGDPSDVEFEEARFLIDEAVQLHRQTGDPRGLAWTLYSQAEIARDQGDEAVARAAATESMEIYQRLGEGESTTFGLYTLATLALADGALAEARSTLSEGTRMALATNLPLQQLRCVEVGAHLVFCEGRSELAVLLYGAADAGREALDQGRWPRRALRVVGEQDRDTLRRRLGPEAMTRIWEQGRRMSISEACGAVVDAEVVLHATEEAYEGPAARSGRSIRLLGEVVIEVDGRPVPLRGQAPAQLLKIVALRGRIQVDEIVEALWPDAAPGTGRRRLNNLLARLRRETGDLLERHGDTLRLVPGTQLDVEVFVAAAEAGLAAMAAGEPAAAALCRRVVGLYRGELLPADRYEDWAAAPRVRLGRLYLDVLDALAQEATASGRSAEAVQWLERGIEAEPLDLTRYERTAAVMLDQGWRHRARALALRARRVSDELGVGLSSDLDRLLQR